MSGDFLKNFLRDRLFIGRLVLTPDEKASCAIWKYSDSDEGSDNRTGCGNEIVMIEKKNTPDSGAESYWILLQRKASCQGLFLRFLRNFDYGGTIQLIFTDGKAYGKIIFHSVHSIDFYVMVVYLRIIL